MAKQPINIDKIIEHALVSRPSATLSDIKRMVPLTSTLHENELAARIQRLRLRIFRQSAERHRLVTRAD